MKRYAGKPQALRAAKGSPRLHGRTLPALVSLLTTLVALACATAMNLHATPILVTSTDDNGPNTLRQALADAVDGDTIDATGLSGTITLTTGQLLVSNSVTILGPGPANLTVDANRLSRVFFITSGHTVTIDGLTIANGSATGSAVL